MEGPDAGVGTACSGATGARLAVELSRGLSPRRSCSRCLFQAWRCNALGNAGTEGVSLPVALTFALFCNRVVLGDRLVVRRLAEKARHVPQAIRAREHAANRLRQGAGLHCQLHRLRGLRPLTILSAAPFPPPFFRSPLSLAHPPCPPVPLFPCPPRPRPLRSRTATSCDGGFTQAACCADKTCVAWNWDEDLPAGLVRAHCRFSSPLPASCAPSLILCPAMRRASCNAKALPSWCSHRLLFGTLLWPGGGGYRLQAPPACQAHGKPFSCCWLKPCAGRAIPKRPTINSWSGDSGRPNPAPSCAPGQVYNGMGCTPRFDPGTPGGIPLGFDCAVYIHTREPAESNLVCSVDNIGPLCARRARVCVCVAWGILRHDVHAVG